MTDEVPIETPYLKVDFNGEDIGFSDNSVLKFDKTRKQWYKYMELPIKVSNAIVFDGKIVIGDRQLNNKYVLDIEEKKVIEFELQKPLVNLSENEIETFSIEDGSQGCFHSYQKLVTYNLNGNIFKLQKKEKNS